MSIKSTFRTVDHAAKREAAEKSIASHVLKGDILVDLNGHFGSKIGPAEFDAEHYGGVYSAERMAHRLVDAAFGGYGLDDILVISDRLEAGEIIDYSTFEVDDTFASLGQDIDCWVCGKRLMASFEGGVIKLVTGKELVIESWGDIKSGVSPSYHHKEPKQLECEFPGGLGEYTVEIDVPSGKLAFANDLRRLTNEEEPDFYVNADIGVKECVDWMASQGIFHSFVGNTCPSVSSNGDRINVGALYNSEADCEVFEEGFEKRGSICTDLWWFSAMDYDEFNARCEAKGVGLKGSLDCVVDVSPGRYRMTVRQRVPDSSSYVRASIEKVEPES